MYNRDKDWPFITPVLHRFLLTHVYYGWLYNMGSVLLQYLHFGQFAQSQLFQERIKGESSACL